MSKKTTDDERQSQRDRCLEILANLKTSSANVITPTLVTKKCMEVDLFTTEQLKTFSFQRARQQVEQWMKTPDASGMQTWGQLPLTDGNGERVWDRRRDMKIDGYAWNYLQRDDLVQENMAARDRWMDEALEKWSLAEFEAEVERLREERLGNADAA